MILSALLLATACTLPSLCLGCAVWWKAACKLNELEAAWAVLDAASDRYAVARTANDNYNSKLEEVKSVLWKLQWMGART